MDLFKNFICFCLRILFWGVFEERGYEEKEEKGLGEYWREVWKKWYFLFYKKGINIV